MRRSMFALILPALGLLASLITSPPLLAAGLSLPEALNVAGRQRMLTQRIVKSYAMVLLDLQVGEAASQLQGAVALFERQLQQLKEMESNTEVKAGLAEVERLWLPFRELTSPPYSREGLERLAAGDDAVLAAAHRVVVVLEGMSGTPAGRLVNLAGRQRMISQRIAKFYMLRSLGYETDATAEGLSKAAAEFKGALDELSGAPQNTAEIQTALKEVQRRWTVFEAAFDMSKGKYAPFLIARYSEDVLTRMNEITGMYASLGEK